MVALKTQLRLEALKYLVKQNNMEPFNKNDGLIFIDPIRIPNYEQAVGLDQPQAVTDFNFGKPIQSTNFKIGVTGWRLNSNGTVEINGNVPASATDTGTKGMVAFSSTHIYYCVATNTWKRVAIATWV
jgi:hypothetical protein